MLTIMLIPYRGYVRKRDKHAWRANIQASMLTFRHCAMLPASRLHALCIQQGKLVFINTLSQQLAEPSSVRCLDSSTGNSGSIRLCRIPIRLTIVDYYAASITYYHFF